MTRQDQADARVIERQMNCLHDPQPIPGFAFVKRCSKCHKIFGRSEWEAIDKQYRLDVESKRPQ